MLDMGFLTDVRTVIKRLPARRQTILFSATLPKDIDVLAGQILKHPARVSVAPPSAAAEGIRQSVYYVEPPGKRLLLLKLLEDVAATRVLVFVRTRHGADRLMSSLRTAKIRTDAIHADRPQPDRLRALAAFTAGETRVLVATEIASRGIDIEGITHVINFDVPNVPESYIHRIGRTARAGAEGVAISLCSKEERPYIVEIERVMRRKLEVAG